jgi:hypothetical protein
VMSVGTGTLSGMDEQATTAITPREFPAPKGNEACVCTSMSPG